MQFKDLLREHLHRLLIEVYRPVSLDPALLAVLEQEKERCRERHVAFFTPNLLSALFSMRGDIPERALTEAAGATLSAEIRDALVRYSPLAAPGSSMAAFADFAWETREDVQQAQKMAREEHSAVVTARHLLVSVLERPSNSQKSLHEKLGEERFRALVDAARRIPAMGTAYFEALNTPGKIPL
jgi:ATP-dependent Clp protease ATP-binding subunit ClpA